MAKIPFKEIKKLSKPKISSSIYYAGIGSRETPKNIQVLMTQIAKFLEKKGFILRSGGADGADKAFERGVKDDRNKEIFLYRDADGDETAAMFVYMFHPQPNSLGRRGFLYQARNTYQVLGKPLSHPEPVRFVICWTPDGASFGDETQRITGGTGQAIRVASSLGITVYNLQREDVRKMWIDLLKAG